MIQQNHPSKFRTRNELKEMMNHGEFIASVIKLILKIQ